MRRENRSPRGAVPVGKDEMNLAEFPVCTVSRHDKRDVLQYVREVRKEGKVEYQTWAVRGAAGIGLPTEFADRVLITLVTLAAEQGFQSRKVTFSVYRILKLMGLRKNKNSYQRVETALKQLAGVTITSEGAFWDHKRKRNVNQLNAFHIIDRVWLKYMANDDPSVTEENGNGFIMWGDYMWDNLQAGYVKTIDLDFYHNTLRKPLARLLYRLLDKRMHHNKDGVYWMDIWALSDALGMIPQQHASAIRKMLKGPLEELVETGFLCAYEFRKEQNYDRVYFFKSQPEPFAQLALHLEEKDSREHPPEPTVFTELDLVWSAVLEQLALTMPSGTFDMYIRPTRLLAIDNGVATIAIPAASGDWIENQLRRQLQNELNAHTDQLIEALQFTLLPQQNHAEG